VIGAVRIEAHKGRRLRFAARCDNRVSRQHEGWRREEHQRGIAVMMRKRILPSVIVTPANILRPAAIFYITREWIGKMNMMMRMFEAIHDSDIGLRRQHDAQRHAEDGDCSSESAQSLPAQRYLVSGDLQTSLARLCARESVHDSARRLDRRKLCPARKTKKVHNQLI
jgi:hypothetical protein